MRRKRFFLNIPKGSKRHRGVVHEGREEGNPPDSKMAPVFATIEEAEQAIRNLPYEILCVFGIDGKYLAGGIGDERAASLPDENNNLVKDAVCTHNHPSGNVFSLPDIRFIRDLDPAEFRVVTSTKCFRVIRPDSGWPLNLLTGYRKWYTTFYKRYETDKEKGKLSEAEFSRRVFRDALNKTVKEFKLDYREEDL